MQRKICSSSCYTAHHPIVCFAPQVRFCRVINLSDQTEIGAYKVGIDDISGALECIVLTCYVSRRNAAAQYLLGACVTLNIYSYVQCAYCMQAY